MGAVMLSKREWRRLRRLRDRLAIKALNGLTAVLRGLTALIRRIG